MNTMKILQNNIWEIICTQQVNDLVHEHTIQFKVKVISRLRKFLSAPSQPIPSSPSMLLLFSHSVKSDSLWPHGLQHTRPPCPSLSPGVCSNLCPLSQWYHPTISTSVIPFSSHLQSFPASGSFSVSWLFTSGGQSIGASVSASVLPMNIEHRFPSGWTGLISLQSKGLSRVFSNTTTQKHQFFHVQPSLWSNSHPYMTTRKTTALTIWTFVSKVSAF